MKIKHLITLCVITIATISYGVCAAPIEELPTTVIQPSGQELDLYVSGDEFFNYLHDEDGNIIIKNYDNGYYYYAIIEDGNVVAGDTVVSSSEFEVMSSNSASIGSEYIKLEDIPEEYIENKYESSPLNEIQAISTTRGLVNERKTHPFLYETVNNIVIFIDFPDVTFNSTLDAQYFNEILNTNDNSLKSWFETASYGKTSLVSHLYPTPNGTLIGTYTDIYPRTTYAVDHKDANGNDVYVLNGEVVSRSKLEHDLLERAVNAVSSEISEELNVDIDTDNYVDSITFIIAGNSGAWNTLLWSHKWSMSRNAYINGKRVSTYTFVMENEVRPNGRYNSVLQHELFHLYGAPDLYHYKSGYGTIVGKWDNMDSSSGQMVCTYMKYKYGNWIDRIPEIKSDTQTYTINKNTLPTNNCYVLRSPYSTNEFFVVEYRKKESPFENAVPGDGIVVFRIDSRFSGNANYNGTTILDEVYVSRSNPSANQARYPYYADEVSLFFQDGSAAGIILKNFELTGDTASFEVEFTYNKLLGHFMDKRIVNAIASTLNKSIAEITEEDLETITSLSLSSVGNYDLSVSLEGVEQLTNLQTLILNDCKIEDISPISSLSNLTHLELVNNEIEDFSPLENLTALTHLEIRGNIADDYSATAEYYESITQKDFSLENKNDIIFSIPNYNNQQNIGAVNILCSETIPDKINIIIEKHSADGTILLKTKRENVSLMPNARTLYLPAEYNCEDGSYLVIRAYERRRFEKLISECIVKPVILDLSVFD